METDRNKDMDKETERDTDRDNEMGRETERDRETDIKTDRTTNRDKDTDGDRNTSIYSKCGKIVKKCANQESVHRTNVTACL